MKKLVLAVMFACLCCGVADATEYSVTGKSDIRFYDEAKTGPVIGGRVNFSEVPYLPENVILSTGLDYAKIETQDVSPIEVDVVTIPIEAGYKFQLDEKLSITPKAGVDLILTGDNAENAVGVHVGSSVDYAFNDRFSAGVNVAYNFAEVEIAGVDRNLSGASVGGSATYKF